MLQILYAFQRNEDRGLVINLMIVNCLTFKYLFNESHVQKSRFFISILLTESVAKRQKTTFLPPIETRVKPQLINTDMCRFSLWAGPEQNFKTLMTVCYLNNIATFTAMCFFYCVSFKPYRYVFYFTYKSIKHYPELKVTITMFQLSF